MTFVYQYMAFVCKYVGHLHDHAIDDAEFFVDGGPGFRAGSFEVGMDVQHETFGEPDPIERVFQDKHDELNSFPIRSSTRCLKPPNRGSSGFRGHNVG